jgi:hypothetical protein
VRQCCVLRVWGLGFLAGSACAFSFVALDAQADIVTPLVLSDSEVHVLIMPGVGFSLLRRAWASVDPARFVVASPYSLFTADSVYVPPRGRHVQPQGCSRSQPARCLVFAPTRFEGLPRRPLHSIARFEHHVLPPSPPLPLLKDTPDCGCTAHPRLTLAYPSLARTPIRYLPGMIGPSAMGHLPRRSAFNHLLPAFTAAACFGDDTAAAAAAAAAPPPHRDAVVYFSRAAGRKRSVGNQGALLEAVRAALLPGLSLVVLEVCAQLAGGLGWRGEGSAARMCRGRDGGRDFVGAWEGRVVSLVGASRSYEVR